MKAADTVAPGMSTAMERAQRGAALLDEKRPGWWRDIDLGRLDVSTGCTCIAGQLGGFSEVTRELGTISLEAQVAHGFEADDDAEQGTPLPVVYSAAERDYKALTAAWRSLILGRRTAEAVSVP